MSQIEFRNVHHAYADRLVLDGIDLTLTEGRVGIVGANGSGKSTLARMINGLVDPTSGVVSIDGLHVAKNRRAVRRKVGFIFTNPDNQIVMPTVGEDVAFTLRRTGLSKDQVATRTAAALDRFGLSELAEQPAHLLSGGQKQLLAMASVIVGDPAIVVADEPTTLLDYRNARMINEMLAGLDQQVVVVTHHLHLLENFDRVIVIEDGRVYADDTPQRALDAYRALLG
ncbi:biotin transport system ATP-binding protein [Antricoccus suffuscus]|uniref:Biotin transport system ATP-binding protein n=1 Tax=Antricoccus suffuscus TaxID=1629062 RepID=A0A2T1A511_9ACTN|nr:ABC transporter ATP-binding protein [Antricoccus suffuscus]PRZ43690.1 biotin transport system ATP-binding protein [Antricoccus suffuscus]